MMLPEPAVATYVIPESYERALEKLRQAINERGLAVCSELDIAARIHRELGIRVNPARILYVDSPGLLLEAMTLFSPLAALLPLHVVVSARGGQTTVHVLSAAQVAASGIPAPARAPICRLQLELTGILQRIAMREGITGA